MVLKHTQVRDEAPHVTPPHLRQNANANGGFSLVEVMVALGIVVMVVVLSAPVFVSALSRTANIGSRQTAVTVASQQLEYVRSLRGSALVTNRPKSLVVAMNTPPSPGIVDLSQDIVTPAAGDLLNYDVNATPADGSAATVRLSRTETLNRTVFTTRTFINACNLAAAGTACTRAATARSHEVYRVSVDVSWPKTSGESCKSAITGSCEYVATTLRDPSSDPIFTRLAPPVFTAMTESYLATPVLPPVVHPLQQVSLTITGSNLQYGLVLQSNDPSDVVTLTSLTAASLTASFTASASTTIHSLVIANPDGGSVTVPVQVAQSSPSVSTVTPALALRVLPITLSIGGTDFYTDSTGKLPLVTLTGSLVSTTLGSIGTTIAAFSSSAGIVTMTSSTALSVQYPAGTFPAPQLPVLTYKFVGSVTVSNPDSDGNGGGQVTYPNFTLSLT